LKKWAVFKRRSPLQISVLLLYTTYIRHLSIPNAGTMVVYVWKSVDWPAL